MKSAQFGPLRKLVLKKLHDCFPEAQKAAIALTILDSYGVQSWHVERDRVQLAMLMQSKGNLDRLRELAVLADKDYRDVLAGAEYPEEFLAPFNTPTAEMSAIRRRDRHRYETWLESDPG
jgi:hypothetical protein